MRRTHPWLLTAWLVACSSSTATPSNDPPPSDDATPGDDSSDGASNATDSGSPSNDATPGGGDPTDATSPPDADDGVDKCPDGFPRGAAGDVRQVTKISPAPEGVAACANGDVFVSVPDEGKILRVPLEGGEPEVWTTLAGRQPLGMTCADNVLYVVDFRSNDATVLRVAAKDDPGTPMPNVDGGGSFKAMNGVVAVKGLGIYATDASNTPSGRIVRFAETAPGVYKASVVKSGLAFPNGIVFDPATNTMDVSLTVQSQVLTFPVGADGALGDSKGAWSGTPVFDAIDGIVRDENKSLYIAHYSKGYVERTSDGAKIASLKDPKSLVFRGGTLLITGTEGLYAAPLGICGIP